MLLSNKISKDLTQSKGRKLMLDIIGLENFKGFKKLEGLKVKPITILCGVNSCGKSSILQNILLFKQTLESKNPKQMLLLNGRFVHLGTFNNITFEQRSENVVTLKFRFKIKRSDFLIGQNQNRLFYHILGELLPSETFSDKNAEHLISYEISLKALDETKIRPTKVIFKIETKISDETVISGIDISINLVKNGLYDVLWKNVETRTGTEKEHDSGSIRSCAVTFANLFPLEISPSNEKEERIRTSDVMFVFYRLNSLLQKIFDSYTYIGPLREEPSRRYVYEDEIVEIGNKGENAAYVYLSEQDKPIEKHYFYEANDDCFKKKPALPLSEALSKWLDLMKIRELKPEPANEIIYLKLNSSSDQKTRVNIADVGFGVSQIFPILLEGLRMSERHTLLLEQPEIHLHPNLQMQMADYFIALALSNKRVIAETHSDHIINRLVRRMVEDKTNRLKELIGIYFITADENEGLEFEEVSIGKSGIKNWPKEFFDQTANEQEKTILASMYNKEIIQ